MKNSWIKIKRIILNFLKYSFILFVSFNLIILLVSHFGASCKSNSEIQKYDIIIVLGIPADAGCKPGQVMKDRVLKGIELYNHGFAKNILFTGSSVRNDCFEADVMAAYAISQGISRASIIKENKAKNTFENAYFSVAKMIELNYTSAAIVTSQAHVRRSCAIFSKFDIDFTTYGANNPPDISKSQLLFWRMGERMILAHHIIFGYPEVNN